MKNELLEIIGCNIRLLRYERDFSQESFAQHVGIDRSYMGQVERGERNLAALNLIKIANALGVPVGDLFKGV